MRVKITVLISINGSEPKEIVVQDDRLSGALKTVIKELEELGPY